ncbi:universal stress protein [Streptomyces pseudovenezuelae]|uniref:Nucleotide-binding universal stress UspA family protein n=1 Tax=Streptomyces pseudovenezuelae TaxID=67350 RepID=A0ABT6LPI9_9ACTN|nr:universal stress protein [Streptomyces pseudovenezuelae]MDH6218228.1 nucleotide-binding universal stress UspA family protein [Streptomyces pseudovenezuelae]
MSGSGACEGLPGAVRVVAGVSGSPGSLTALRRAAREAARRGGELWPVIAWELPGGEFHAARSSVPPPLRERCEQLAREELLDVLDTMFGAAGPGVPLHALIARGRPGQALVQIADRDTDVLVLGAGHRGRLHRLLSPSVSHYCLTHATCPVLAVPPSPLEAHLATVCRRNSWHLRLDAGQLTEREKPRGRVRDA